MLRGFKGLVLYLSPPKCSEFSHKASGATTPGKAAVDFDDHVFATVQDLRLSPIEAQANVLLDPLLGSTWQFNLSRLLFSVITLLVIVFVLT